MNAHHLFALTILATTPAAADTTMNFETTCGPSKFQVIAINHGIPFDNSYTLNVSNSSGLKTLYKDHEGGWFNAACLKTKSGKQLLVFQDYCSGSVCTEGKYGVIDPVSLKPLLLPPSSNSDNQKLLSKLLGYPVSELNKKNGAFCCEK